LYASISFFKREDLRFLKTFLILNLVKDIKTNGIQFIS